MNDYKTLAEQFLAAITEASNAQISANGINLQNTNASINNQANAKGTLYSTEPAFRQTQAAAKNVQNNSAINKSLLENTFSVRSSILDTQHKIEAMNRAASELNKMVFEF